ncbi:MAG: hypothetical protein ACE5EZ_03570, partial [Thermodesulfobacteriota bacterium]
SSVADATITDNSLTWTAGVNYILVSSNVVGTSSLTGTAVLNIGLAGTSVGLSSESGGISFQQALTGAVSGVSTLSGTLTIAGVSVVFISGSISVVSAISGNALCNYALLGTASAVGTMGGSFNIEVGTQGTIASVASHGASLLVSRGVIGVVNGSSFLTASITGLPVNNIYGQVNALSAFSGGVAMGYGLSGSSISDLLLSGEIHENISCGGTFSGISSMSGLPVVLGPFSPATLARSARIDVTRFGGGPPPTVQTGDSRNTVTKITTTPG